MLNKWGSQLNLNATIMGAIATINILQPQLALSLTPEEIYLQATGFTVKIDGAKRGSGVIVEKVDNQYTVLTNWHVVDGKDNYIIKTSDGRPHKVSKIQRIQGVDLAFIYFNSSQYYPVARRGNSDNLSKEQTIHYAGYPGKKTPGYPFFDSQRITGFVEKLAIDNGYEIIFNGNLMPGMSGSPLINDNGILIGIYGKGEIRSDGTYLYGIPINKAGNVGLGKFCNNLYQRNTAKLVDRPQQESLAIQILELVNQGHQHIDQSQYTDALNQYTQAIELAEKHELNCHDPWYYQGIALVKLRVFDEAINSFDQALKIEPNNYNTWCKKGRILSGIKQRQEAQKSYQQAISITPNASEFNQDCQVLSERFSE